MLHRRYILSLAFLFVNLVCLLTGWRTPLGGWGAAQELNCSVKIIHTQVQGSNMQIFETLETAINEFMNNRAWTDLQFQKEERIDCTMSITVKKYDESAGQFTCEMLFQVNRPVYNSAYTSTVFSMRDKNFNFMYREFDPLEFNENNIDNNLTALLAYYAYLFIGMELDSFSPLGGTAALRVVESITNSAQTMAETGWKAFDDASNRHGIINDYMETSMEPFRMLIYKYHRLGLDEMHNNVDRGRVAITECIEMLKEARSNRPLSQLPQIFTDYKRDEMVSIYQGHGTEKEKNTVYDILSNINASQNTYWNKIKK